MEKTEQIISYVEFFKRFESEIIAFKNHPKSDDEELEYICDGTPKKTRAGSCYDWPNALTDCTLCPFKGKCVYNGASIKNDEEDVNKMILREYNKWMNVKQWKTLKTK
jgi:hypothetical protein